MPRYALALAILTLVAGCSGPDPESSKLEPGAVVMLYSELRTETHPGELSLRVGGQRDFVALGTLVRVAVDAGPEADKGRMVQGIIREGPHKGEGVEVRRSDLRPAKD